MLQDCTVGLLFALLPVLGGAGGLGEGVLSFVKVATTLALFLAATTAASKTVVARAFRFISPRGGELYQMVTVAFCLVVAWTSEWLGLSIELGALVAGVMASATPFTEQTLHAVRLETVLDRFPRDPVRASPRASEGLRASPTTLAVSPARRSTDRRVHPAHRRLSP